VLPSIDEALDVGTRVGGRLPCRAPAERLGFRDDHYALSFSRRMTDPMPLTRPPPRTVRPRRRSGLILDDLSADVALPPITADSATGWMNTPSSPAKLRVVSTVHHSSKADESLSLPVRRGLSLWWRRALRHDHARRHADLARRERQTLTEITGARVNTPRRSVRVHGLEHMSAGGS